MTKKRFWLTRPASTALALAVVAIVGGCGGDSTPGPTATASSGRSKALEASGDSPGVKIVALTKISEKRISRTVFDYVFKVTVQNDSVARNAIMATAIGAGQGTTILDGSILVGDLSASATAAPSDTITLRSDRALPFSPSALVWRITEPINGNAVPPEPDSSLNNSTLAGIDTNGNGVRDDVERQLAGKLSLQTDYASAIRYAAAYQSLSTAPAPTSRAHALASFIKVVCAVESASRLVRDIEVVRLLATTKDRQAAFSTFFTALGAFSSSEVQSCGS